MAALAEIMVAKKRGRPKTSERNDRTAKVDAKVLGMAEMVARGKGIPLAQYLSEALSPIVAKDFAKMMEQLKEGKLP